MTIEEKLKVLPESSGVYLMYDIAGNVIYVGKAVVLKNRVRQYFMNTFKPPKVQAMVETVADFGYIVTLSEKDALSLEANLIKKYQPKFNILLKDDKGSPYIKIDLTQDFPTLEVTRRPKKEKARYFGPFIHGVRVWEIINIIKAAYKMRACPKRLGKKECLNYHLHLCLAPCAGRVNKEDYRAVVDKVMAFLQGRDEEARLLLEKRMKEAVESEEFERAIGYREQLEMLKKLKDKGAADLKIDENTDAIAYACDGLYSAAAVNIIRNGKMMGVKNYPLNDAGLNSEETLTSFINQYYADNEIPPEIIINLNFDTAALKEYLSGKYGALVEVKRAEKGAKKRLIDMAEKNANEFLASSLDKVRREHDMTIGACERLSEVLGIKSARMIECYDISNLSGTDNVASGICFLDGSPFKSDYRRYKIKSVEGADDFASIYEVMLRRFTASEHKRDNPDLVVIDGGLGQLHAAAKAIKECGYDLPLISLAKRDEIIYREWNNEPLSLTKSDHALRLLQRIRDEAHRFAISYNRTLRQKKYDSELLKIDGVGAKTRQKLQRSLSFSEIKSLTAGEISVRAQIDKKTAQNIEDYFKKQE